MSNENKYPGSGLTRRALLTGTFASLATVSALGWPKAAMAAPAADGGLKGVKALTFDVLGTVVDFYTPIMRMGRRVNRREGLSLDWSAITREWRDLYRKKIAEVAAGKRPFLPVEAIFRESLDELLAKHGVAQSFDPAERDKINHIWRRQIPWRDTRPGLKRLQKRFTVCTLTNVDTPSLVENVKRMRLPFDVLIPTQLTKTYKPAKEVYKLALEVLSLEAPQVMMVAAHKYDLKAAKELGFKTAFVPRPREYGPGAKVDEAKEAYIDVYAEDFIDLARRLGA